MADDIVRDLLKRLARWVPAEEATRVELEVRQHWGKARVYVKAPPDPKVRMCAESLAAGAPIREASERSGASLATGYRLAKRLWRCR